MTLHRRSRTATLTVASIQAVGDETILNSNRLDALTAVVRGMELRICDLESGVGNFKPHEMKPQNLSEAHVLIAALQRNLLDALVRSLTKHGYLTSDKDGGDLEPLPQIVDRASLSLYTAMVVDRMQSKRITAPEARALLYAAQVAMSLKRHELPAPVPIMEAMGEEALEVAEHDQLVSDALGYDQ